MPLIDPGKKAPAFSLKDQHGHTHALADYAGQHVVLYFYPKDDTPGCTKESCDFQVSLPTYKRRKAAVLGVSILDEKSKAKFATKHGLPHPTLMRFVLKLLANLTEPRGGDAMDRVINAMTRVVPAV